MQKECQAAPESNHSAAYGGKMVKSLTITSDDSVIARLCLRKIIQMRQQCATSSFFFAAIFSMMRNRSDQAQFLLLPNRLQIREHFLIFEKVLP
jgi:hypothetical protein